MKLHVWCKASTHSNIQTTSITTVRCLAYLLWASIRTGCCHIHLQPLEVTLQHKQLQNKTKVHRASSLCTSTVPTFCFVLSRVLWSPGRPEGSTRITTESTKQTIGQRHQSVLALPRYAMLHNTAGSNIRLATQRKHSLTATNGFPEMFFRLTRYTRKQISRV